LKRSHSEPDLKPARAEWMRRADLLLIALAVLGLALHSAAESTRQWKPQAHLQEKLAAATRTLRCFETVRDARLGAMAVDPENDPEGTGLIGQEHTLTTTDRGVLEAKLTSVNPNFAAVFVDYYHQAGLEPGDAVALALTGSFPALNIAALAAAEEMKLKPVAITSVGASMWGANDPSFGWLDMERLLRERRLLNVRSVAASLGGSNDRGRGLSPKGRSLLREAIVRNEVELISEPTLEQSISRRLEIYRKEAGPGGIRAFVNVGGGSASVGNQQGGDLIAPGVSRKIPVYNWAQRGVLHHLSRSGVPIVHILKIEQIAREHGLPYAPERIPPVGEGDIFYREAYDLRIVIPSLVIYLALCFGVLRARQKAAKSAREVPDPVLAVDPVLRASERPVGERSGG